jgi:adenosylcobinamide kinase / adenosylcobinamide-phosphate guanylyltransferase
MPWGFFVFRERESMSRIVFIIGGTRSGKSSFALSRATAISGRKVYVATAQAYDAEMSERISKHRQERGPEWETREEPVRLGEALRKVSATFRVVIVDCLTIWLSNLLCSSEGVGGEEEDFLKSLSQARKKNVYLFIVSSEVGMGIVPENELARRFRDMAGKLNQRVAQIADEVFLVAAGIPVKIK